MFPTRHMTLTKSVRLNKYTLTTDREKKEAEKEILIFLSNQEIYYYIS